MVEKTSTPTETRTPAVPSVATFHHVGFVVASIAETAADFARSLGAEWTGKIIHDPLQQARVSFMRCGAPHAPAVELVEPDSEKSPLNKFLSKGGGLHHICYEVDSLETQLEYCRSVGSLIVRAPLPAVAFGGRRIAWTYTKQKLLVEYLER
jgi:methylmalonyl-CoA/ethylmalonyl-CoA epimerase